MPRAVLRGAVFSPGRQTALCQCLRTRRTWQTCTKQKMLKNTSLCFGLFEVNFFKKKKKAGQGAHICTWGNHMHTGKNISSLSSPLCSRVWFQGQKCKWISHIHYDTFCCYGVFTSHRELDAAQGRGDKNRSNQMPELEAKVRVVSVNI